MDNCLFCKIIAGQIPSTKVYEDDRVVAFLVIAKKIGKAILASGLAEGFNIGVNAGKAAGQSVDHTHIHVMPRRMGDPHRLWVGKAYAAGQATMVADKLQKQLR